MAAYIAYKCKTENCGTWLKRQKLPDDTERTITVVLETRPINERIQCPECRQEHKYTEADGQKIVEK